jgi:photosynthetic reaction center H subunit
MTGTIIGTIDFAQVALYLFWVFFFGLVIWLQRENMREGYPLESEVTGKPVGARPFGLPSPKTFKLPHGQGEIQKPGYQDGDERDFSALLARTDAFSGAPYEPTGDPLADGVGPAAWCERAEFPDLMHDGSVKIVPLATAHDFSFAQANRSIIGHEVRGADGEVGGSVKDVWVDKAEHLIRYVEIELPDGTSRVVPMTLCVVSWWGKVIKIHSLKAAQFAGVPQTAEPDQITLREEDRISAYWSGGKLYADSNRLESQI